MLLFEDGERFTAVTALERCESNGSFDKHSEKASSSELIAEESRAEFGEQGDAFYNDSSELFTELQND